MSFRNSPEARSLFRFVSVELNKHIISHRSANIPRVFIACVAAN